MPRMKRLYIFIGISVLATGVLFASLMAGAQIKPADRACQSDGDCVLITTSCKSCCPGLDLSEVDAVNHGGEKNYKNLGICTAAHIKSCGVPECGLFPTPYPVAVCQQRSCAVTMHPPRPIPR